MIDRRHTELADVRRYIDGHKNIIALQKQKIQDQHLTIHELVLRLLSVSRVPLS